MAVTRSKHAASLAPVPSSSGGSSSGSTPSPPPPPPSASGANSRLVRAQQAAETKPATRRKMFSEQQNTILQAAFERYNSIEPVGDELNALASKVQREEQQLKRWFLTRRSRLDVSSIIAAASPAQPTPRRSTSKASKAAVGESDRKQPTSRKRKVVSGVTVLPTPEIVERSNELETISGEDCFLWAVSQFRKEELEQKMAARRLVELSRWYRPQLYSGSVPTSMAAA